MSLPYEESLEGETFLRQPPPPSHEALCDRLHALVAAALPPNSTLKLLPRRSAVQIAANTRVCPDLALVKSTPEGPVLCLAAEVLLPGDHHADTVIKKPLYGAAAIPRLWIVDPRYRNVEVYGIGDYGLQLEAILANQDRLADAALPGLGCTMRALFAVS